MTQESNNTAVTRKVAEAIEKALPGARAFVSDPYRDNTHLQAVVVSSEFAGKSRVEAQRLVMNALKADFASDLHALGLRTMTPEQWESAR